MAKTVGTSELLEVWGSNRTGGATPPLSSPTLGVIEGGFADGAVASPNDATWAINQVGEKVNHLLQNGIPAWVATTTYAIGDFVSHGGQGWVALASSTNSTPSGVNSDWAKVALSTDLGATTELLTLSTGIIKGLPPAWASTTAVNFPTETKALDSTGAVVITVASGTVNWATTGLNGLDTGAIAADTWYWAYALRNPSTGATGYIVSTNTSTPTLPSGFTQYRRLPYAFKTKELAAEIQVFHFRHTAGLVDCWWGETRTDETLATDVLVSEVTVDLSSTIPTGLNGTNAGLKVSVLTYGDNNAGRPDGKILWRTGDAGTVVQEIGNSQGNDLSRSMNTVENLPIKRDARTVILRSANSVTFNSTKALGFTHYYL